MNVEKESVSIPPITSVKKIGAIMVNIMKNMVGPFSIVIDPVAPANHLKT